MSKLSSDSFYYVGLREYYIKYPDGFKILYSEVIHASSEKEAIELFCGDILNKYDYNFLVFPIENATFMHINNFGCFVSVSSDKFDGVIDMFKIDSGSIDYIQSICNYEKE